MRKRGEGGGGRGREGVSERKGRGEEGRWGVREERREGERTLVSKRKGGQSGKTNSEK